MNIEKLIQITGYILKKYDGILNYTKLIKILYLADRKSFSECGTSITGDVYVSMKDGPVLCGLYNLIKNRYPDKSIQYYWNSKFQTDRYDLHCAGVYIPTGKLSDFDMETLDSIDSEFHNYSYSQMIDYVHDKKNCPEWKNTSSSIPLSKSEILKNIGFSDEDIVSIIEEDNLYEEEDKILESLNEPVTEEEIYNG